MRKLAIDMSSFLWTALTAGKDNENGQQVMFNDRKVLVNSAKFGYENIINMMAMVLRDERFTPKDCLLVFEGLNSKSRRVIIDPTYKNGGAPSHPAEAYIEFQNLREMLIPLWRSLGACILIQDLAEGDDVLGWLAREYEGPLTIATYDGDLTVLNTEDGQTNEYGGTTTVWINGIKGVNKYGAFDFRYVRLYKALVGDTSDNVKGAFKFGEASFHKLVALIGWDGVEELIGLLDKGSLDDLAALAEEDSKVGKLVKLIYDSKESVLKAWRVVQIHPEWVNTVKHPLKFLPGKIEPAPEDADERLVQWFGSNFLITAENYKDAMETLLEAGPKSPFITFDIETSTPPESDDWLALQGDPDGVDQMGSVLTGFSITFGENLQYTIYVSVDHADTRNITMVQARELLEAAWDLGLENVIHNTFFELSVMYNAQDEDGTLWRDHWKDNGYHGFIPRILDTKLEASYVNENIPLGLKKRSLTELGYEQQSFKTTTTIVFDPHHMYGEPQGEETVLHMADWGRGRWSEVGGTPPGGDPESDYAWIRRHMKMDDLPAWHVFGYGADDTICTAALHSYYQLVMMLEHTWDAYLETEIDAAYQHAKNFVDGMTVSIERSRELERKDDAIYDEAWATVRAYLIEKGWNGTQPPTYTAAISCKEIKEAYAIYTGRTVVDEEPDEEDDEDTGAVEEESDSILKSKMRTPAKMVPMIREAGHEVFASMLERCLKGEAEEFTAWIRTFFKGEPMFKTSNKQMCHLLYEVMGLPIRIRGKVSKVMRSKGIKVGNPAGNDLALSYALRDTDDEQLKAVMNGIKLMTMVKTRRQLYYSKYPAFVHWKTGKVHGSHNQSATNTRRASESKPNKQQLPKHEKIEGEPPEYRKVLVPHRSDAVVVSMDFDSQELRVIADYSRDPNMVACYVGENKKDMHSLTAVAILEKRNKDGVADWSYDTFIEVLHNDSHPSYKFAKTTRALGKKTNFTTEYGAMAPKLAQTLMCTEAEAQTYIDAKEAAFPVVGEWKEAVIGEARNKGFVTTMDGARRHLRDALVLGDRFEQSKAERQAVNTLVQGSCAAMTKRAEGRMWRRALSFRYDAVCYGPVHDEVVWSVRISDLPSFLAEMHACMVAPFAGMEIPIESSISFGPSFGEQHEIGMLPTAEAIAAGLAAVEKARQSSKEHA